MWDADNNYIERVGLDENKKILVKDTIKMYNLPAVGLAVVFDDSNYVGNIYPRWSNDRAVYMNIKLGGVEELSPIHLLELMQSRKYSHLIWISKRVCVSDDVDFVWHLAHELRHLEQNIISNFLSIAGNFLTNTLGSINIDEPKLTIIVPTEMDAELSAWRTAHKLFGREKTGIYLAKEASTGKRVDNFRIITSKDFMQPYDVIGNTIKLFRKYQGQLEDFKKQSEDCLIRDFNIDIVCIELSKIRNNYLVSKVGVL